MLIFETGYREQNKIEPMTVSKLSYEYTNSTK